MSNLIERLQARLTDPGRMIDRPGRNNPVVYARASQHAIRQAENELGFPLPKTLREIYEQVANGGIGPSMGLLGIAGGATMDGENAVQLYRMFARAADSLDEMEMDEPPENFAWPDRMLPICYHGCTVYECLDCTMAEPAVYLVDVGEREGGIAFDKTARSLTDWFEKWLNETDSPEPR